MSNKNDNSLANLLGKNKAIAKKQERHVPGTAPVWKTPLEVIRESNPKFGKYISKDADLTNKKFYYEIIKVVKLWYESGVIDRGAGSCLGMSDMVQKVLRTKGIKSKLVECELIITTTDPPSMSLIGQPFNIETARPNADDILNSHVVCITETEPPLLIDTSISHYKEITETPFIIEKLENEDSDPSIIAKLKVNGSTLLYTPSLFQNIPVLYQQSMVDRLKTDKKVDNSIKKINIMLMALFILMGINLIRGMYDFNQKYFIKGNDWGPSRIVEPN